MRTRNRTDGGLLDFHGAGVSPASGNAGETPAIRFVRRAIPWLAALGLAFVCCPRAIAQDKPSKPTATFHAGTPTATITAAKKDLAGKNAEAAERTDFHATFALGSDVIGQFPLTLDQALTAAMEGSPKVVAAKAKLTLAESDLNNTRMEVAQRIVELWAQRQAEQLNYDEFLRANKASPGSVPNANIINAAAIVSHYEMQLRSLIGQATSAPFRGNASAPAPLRQPPKPPQLPHGPVVEKIRKALLTQTEFNFVETPLSDVVDYLKDRHRIEIQLDKQALQEYGVLPETPITFSLKGVSLGAALQAFDDQFQDIKLVVRDYGILVTSPSRVEQRGYFSVVEFARLAAEGGPLRAVGGVLVPALPRSVSEGPSVDAKEDFRPIPIDETPQLDRKEPMRPVPPIKPATPPEKRPVPDADPNPFDK